MRQALLQECGLKPIFARAFDGSVADDFSFQLMLIVEAVVSLVCIGIALLLKRKLRIED